MPPTKYGKYVSKEIIEERKYPKRTAPTVKYRGDRGGKNLTFDWYCVTQPLVMDDEPEVNDFDQYMFIAGGNINDLKEFHAEIELPFWMGSFAGFIPWIAIAVYVAAPGINISPPGFVYGIIISLFIFFNCFAINMVLQYKQVGRWRDYLFGEKVYIILSLTAKALLAWQVFANVLVLK